MKTMMKERINQGISTKAFCRRGFSLTEMMLVMVILLLLLGAAAPTYWRSEQRARESARSLVKSHLQRARSHAIARGVATAVVIPDDAAGELMGGKMLGLAEVEWMPDPERMSGQYRVTRVLQRWEVLPGTMMVYSQLAGQHVRATVMEQAFRSPVTLGGRSVEGVLIVFSPAGQILSPSHGALEILLGPGRVSGGQWKALTQLGQQGACDVLQINRLTGRARHLNAL